MGLLEDVFAVSQPRETQADVIDFYKREYPGSKTNKAGKTTYEWQSQLATDLAQVTGLKRASIMRRFQAERKGKEVSKSHADEYQALGESLPPMPPENGYHIEGLVYMKLSDGDCEEREVDEYITGADAQKLVEQSARDMAQAVVSAYMEDALWNEPSARIGDCDPPALTVSANE